MAPRPTLTSSRLRFTTPPRASRHGWRHTRRVFGDRLEAGGRQAAGPNERSRRGIFRHVDLRPLQLPRVVDVNRFPLRVEIERRLTGLAMAVPGRLRPAEGEVHFGTDRSGVH